MEQTHKKYNIGKKIGAGSFASVYINDDDDNTVVKKYRHFDDQKYFDNEVALSDLLRKNNPCIKNILLPIDSDSKTMSAVYPRMKCHVGRLIRYFNKKFVDIETRAKVARQILRDIVTGLDILATCNIIHGDIKPENIMLDRDPEDIADGQPFTAAITDMGSSFVVGNMLTSTFGTTEYLAPELILSVPSAPITPALDIWSAMLVYYEIVSGSLLFDPHNDCAVSYGSSFEHWSNWSGGTFDSAGNINHHSRMSHDSQLSGKSTTSSSHSYSAALVNRDGKFYINGEEIDADKIGEYMAIHTSNDCGNNESDNNESDNNESGNNESDNKESDNTEVVENYRLLALMNRLLGPPPDQWMIDCINEWSVNDESQSHHLCPYFAMHEGRPAMLPTTACDVDHVLGLQYVIEHSLFYHYEERGGSRTQGPPEGTWDHADTQLKVARLVDFMSRGLQYDPDQRPTPRQLLDDYDNWPLL